MNYQFLEEFKTASSPCSIDYSDKFNVFIVGTYELIENGKSNHKFSKEELTLINNRIGNLNVFKANPDNVLVYEYLCKAGGVFDMKISDRSGKFSSGNYYQDHSSFELIITAHSNGVLGIYKLTEDLKINVINEIQTTCQMLTTIDDQFNLQTNEWSIMVGGFFGKMVYFIWSLESNPTEICLENQHQEQYDSIIEHLVTEYSQPIWYLKMIYINTSIMFIFVCSEDSLWRIFTLRNGTFEQIYQNKDSSCGVTSIEFFGKPKINDNKMVLLIGSYDEHLRIYNLTWTECANNVIDIKCDLLKQIHVEGSGIWRIKSFDENNKILLSAMYSGAYILKLEINKNFSFKINYELEKISLPITTDGDSGKTEHLIYGISSTKDLSQILLSSFYTKKNFLFCLTSNPETTTTRKTTSP